jgi:glycosyltransferase involved in cell wall biosynthesis
MKNIEYQTVLKSNETHGGKIKLIHHGGAIKDRRLELMIKMMRFLDPQKYDLTFMLVPSDKKYFSYLVNLAGKYSNIHFVSPVSFSEIPQTLNGYDIGVYILIPNSFNNKYALPNKLFEFIQARLAVAIGPSIEMVKIVEHYNLGVYSEDFSPESLAKRIAQITPEGIMKHKENADKYARELSAEENIVKIKNIVAELTRS